MQEKPMTIMNIDMQDLIVSYSENPEQNDLFSVRVGNNLYTLLL